MTSNLFNVVKKISVSCLREILHRIMKNVNEAELNIEKEDIDGWLVERMPGYVSVDNRNDVFIELDDKGLHVFVKDREFFIPASVASNLEHRWF